MSLTQRIFADRRRVILPLGVFLLANVVALGVVFWLQQSLDAAEEARMQAVVDLGAARNQTKLAQEQRTGKERADVELKKFYAEILPKDFASARNVTNFWLGRIASESRLTFHQGMYDSEPIRDSRLVKLTGEVTLGGDYADIRKFLYELETAQEFVIIEKVALSQPNATQGNAQLEVALSVATYYLAEGLPGVVSR